MLILKRKQIEVKKQVESEHGFSMMLHLSFYVSWAMLVGFGRNDGRGVKGSFLLLSFVWFYFLGC